MRNTLVVALSFCVLGLWSGRVDAQVSLSVEQPMEVRRLDTIQTFADDIDRQHVAAMERFAGEFEGFLLTMNDIAASVAEATNIWIANPSPLTEAAVTQAVTEGAARGRQAAERVAALEDGIAVTAQALQERLQGHIQYVRTQSHQAKLKTDRATATHHKIDRALIALKRQLAAEGNTTVPPALADKVERLLTSSAAARSIAQIESGVGPLLDEFMTVLEQAARDYRHISRTAMLLTYQAGSVGRIMAHVGAAESIKIRVKLVSDAFAATGALNTKMSSTISQMRDAQRNMGTMLNATQRLPRPGRAVRPLNEAHTHGSDLWARLQSLEEQAGEGR